MGQKEKTNYDDCRVVTPEFRAAYLSVIEPRAMKGTTNKPKYSVIMLIPKKSDLKPYQRLIQAAKVAKFGADKAKWPMNIESPVRDGDDEKYEDTEGFAGHWAIKASKDPQYGAPGLFGPGDDGTGKAEALDRLDPEINTILYPGCYAKAYVYAFAWEFNGKYGVSFSLELFQKTRDGKSFGGKKAGGEVFAPTGGGFTEDEEGDDLDFR